MSCLVDRSAPPFGSGAVAVMSMQSEDGLEAPVTDDWHSKKCHLREFIFNTNDTAPPHPPSFNVAPRLGPE